MPDYRGAYYNGVASLSAALKAVGHETSLVHVYDPAMTEDEFLAKIDAAAPDLVAFSSTTHSFPFVAKAAGWLAASRPDLLTIAGGVHAILNPKEVLETPGIDLVCLGEGEDVLVDICDALARGEDPGSVGGLGWTRDGEARYNIPPRRTSDLDGLPIPDRSIFDYRNLYNERTGAAMMMASRGCPYSCTYCCNQALRRAMGNAKPVIRFHSVDYVIREARGILDDFDFIAEIRFDDDILFLDHAWASEFAERFPAEIGLPFVSNLRPNLATREMVGLLARAGCVEVRVGLESGNDHVRTEVLGRRISRRQIIDTVQLCHEHGMRVMTFNIVGLPFETPDTILDTIELNAEAGADEMQHTIFQPYRGTVLYDKCRERGFLAGQIGYDFFTESSIEQPTVSGRQVRMFQRWFRQLVTIFKVEGRLPARLGRLLRSLTRATLASSAGNALVDLKLRAVHPPYEVLKVALDRQGRAGRPAVAADEPAEDAPST